MVAETIAAIFLASSTAISEALLLVIGADEKTLVLLVDGALTCSAFLFLLSMATEVNSCSAVVPAVVSMAVMEEKKESRSSDIVVGFWLIDDFVGDRFGN